MPQRPLPRRAPPSTAASPPARTFGHGRWLRWAGVVALSAACYTPSYRPEVVPLANNVEAFDMLAALVRARYPRLLVCDRTQRRLQSDWIDASDGAVPGRRRVTVFPTGDASVGIVVEVSWLRLGLDGVPYWTSVAGDVAAERELGAAIRAAGTPGLTRSP